MYFTANFKEAYTSVLCFINYTATESNRNAVTVYVNLSVRAGRESPLPHSGVFPVLTVSHSAPAVRISHLHWLGCYDCKEDK